MSISFKNFLKGGLYGGQVVDALQNSLKTPSPPPTPDYLNLAKEQGEENIRSAIASSMLSNPNMVTPMGNRKITYNKDPITGNLIPTITDELTPEAQKTLEAQQRVDLALSNLGEQGLGRVKDVMGKGFQYGGPDIQTSLNLGNAPQMPINAGTTAQQAIMQRLQPQIEKNRAAARQNLANQGITPGSEAWNNAMAEQQQGESDLYSQAALQGINADMAARSQAVNEAIQSGQFANTAGEQDFARQLGLYNLPLNQITALMSGSQVDMPKFQGYSGQNIEAAPTFLAGQQKSQWDQNIYNQGISQRNANLQAITGGASALASAY